jgi:sarcosine oxidase
LLAGGFVLYNTIVLGLGAVGSAALYQLAKRNDKVLGIDQFSPPHALGSSSGETRITRQAVGEGRQYTPLSLRSYEIFRDLERETGVRLLQVTGGLMLSSPGSGGIHNTADFAANMLSAAKEFDIRHDVLDAVDIRKRFPQFVVQDNEVAYYEYESGVLYADRCIETQLNLAEKLGAEIHRNEKVKSVIEYPGGVKVVTGSGQYRARQVVLSAGPWLPQLVDADLAKLFEIQRQVLFWFDINDCYDSFAPGTFPIFIWELSGASKSIYGFPAIDGPSGGFKIGCAAYNTVVTTETIDREVSPDEIEMTFRQKVEPFFPGAVNKCIRAKVCLYTVTPDSAFVIDRLKGSPAVLVCSPCSGHGFKHTAAIGETIAQLVLDGESKLDISSFKLSRFDPLVCS